MGASQASRECSSLHRPWRTRRVEVSLPPGGAATERRHAMMRRLCMSASLVVLIGLLLAALPSGALAAPIPDVSIYSDYPSITVQPGKQVKFPVRFTNNGTVDREIDLTIAGPSDWKPQLKDRGFLVRRVYLAATKTLTADFQVDPPAGTTTGDYRFTIR